MFRYRVLFSKEGPARFWSHLDLVRTTERALRRAGLPLAFSQGFHPHPRFSFAAPLPVGMAGEKEYCEVELAQNISPKEVFSRLGAVFPEGIRIKNVRLVPPGAPSLMAALERASYAAVMELSAAFPDTVLQEHIRLFLALDVLPVTRKKEGRLQTRNIRPGIYRFQGRVEQNKVYLTMELQAGSSGNVRPEEVIQCFLERTVLPVLPETLKIKRTELFFT